VTLFSALRYVRDDLPAGLGSNARHMALLLAAFMSTEGEAHPSMRQLAAAAGVHTSTVARGIAELEAAGVLAVVRPDAAEYHRRTPSSYRFPHVDISDTARTMRAVSYPQQRASSARTARTTRAIGALTRLDTANSSAHTDSRGTFLPGTGWVREA
jgi:DNA-binding transcriptional MocR family regulator